MSVISRSLKAGGTRASWLLAGLVLGGALGAGGLYATRAGLRAEKSPRGDSQGGEKGGGRAEHEPGVVELTREKWEAAKIEIAPARRGRLALSQRFTGKLGPNEDRLAHIFSAVEGAVHEVRVRFGQRVLP